MSRRERLRDRSAGAVKERVAAAVKERVAAAVKERVAGAVKERVVDAVTNKVVDVAADKAVELAAERATSAVKKSAKVVSNHSDTFWSQDGKKVENHRKKSTQENSSLVSIQISIKVNTDDKALIDDLLTDKKFAVLKQLFLVFQKNDEFYALILERKIKEYLQANAKNQLISVLAGKVINCLDDFYQQLQQRKQPQQIMQSTRPKAQNSYTQVITTYNPSLSLTTEAYNTLISEIEYIIMPQYVLDISNQVNQLMQLDKLDVEAAFKKCPKKTENFLKRLAKEPKAPKLLVCVLSYYQLSKPIMEILARFQKTKKEVFDYILVLEDKIEQYSILSACLENGSSLNLFFKVTTGPIKIGNATKKLSELEKKYYLLESQKALFLPTQKLRNKASVDDIAQELIAEQVRDRGESRIVQQNINDDRGIDLDFISEGFDLMLDYAYEKPYVILFTLSCMIGGVYCYLNYASEENAEFESPSMNF